MNTKLQNELYKKYPILFAERELDVSRTRMCDGICCGDGWYTLIADACKQLNIIAKTFNIVIHFTQIKEKFASLRLYTTVKQKPTNKLSKTKLIVIKSVIGSIIHYAECQSYTMCEYCGNYNITSKQKNKIIYAACDDCWKKIKDGKK